MLVVPMDGLPAVRINGEVAARIFEGSANGNVPSSAFIVDVAPGTGPRRHRHPYDEIFVVVEGTVLLNAGDETRVVTPEEVCVVEAGVAHEFTNLGPGRARLVNIHAQAQVVTEFVGDGPSDGSYQSDHQG